MTPGDGPVTSPRFTTGHRAVTPGAICASPFFEKQDEKSVPGLGKARRARSAEAGMCACALDEPVPLRRDTETETETQAYPPEAEARA